MLNPKIFRERDICGIESDLSDEDVETLGKALATYLIRYSGRLICLGRDDRPSSPRLHAALLKGLLATGAHVIDIDVVPTPVLQYSALHFSADGAIMITGGNESPNHNGFRIICGTTLLYGHSLEEIHRVFQMADFEPGEGNLKEADTITPYIEELTSQFRFSRPMKFALDPNGVPNQTIFQHLLKPLNMSVVTKKDAAVGVSICANALCSKVSDDKGQPVAPEMLLLLFAREILARKPESVLLCDEGFSMRAVKLLTDLGAKIIQISSSEPSVQSRVKQEHAELSVQGSGSIVFADRYFGFEDAIYAACRLLEILANSEERLSAMIARLEEDLARC
jgi:phosphomannomutase / phosphoglucomutase